MPKFHHANIGVTPDQEEAEISFLVDILGYRRLEPSALAKGYGARWFEADDGSQIHLSVDADHVPPRPRSHRDRRDGRERADPEEARCGRHLLQRRRVRRPQRSRLQGSGRQRLGAAQRAQLTRHRSTATDTSRTRAVVEPSLRPWSDSRAGVNTSAGTAGDNVERTMSSRRLIVLATVASIGSIVALTTPAAASVTKGSPQPELKPFTIAPRDDGGGGSVAVLASGTLLAAFTVPTADDRGKTELCILPRAGRACSITSPTITPPPGASNDVSGVPQVLTAGGKSVDLLIGYSLSGTLLYRSTDGGERPSGHQSISARRSASTSPRWSRATCCSVRHQTRTAQRSRVFPSPHPSPRAARRWPITSSRSTLRWAPPRAERSWPATTMTAQARSWSRTLPPPRTST